MSETDVLMPADGFHWLSGLDSLFFVGKAILTQETITQAERSKLADRKVGMPVMIDGHRGQEAIPGPGSGLPAIIVQLVGHHQRHIQRQPESLCSILLRDAGGTLDRVIARTGARQLPTGCVTTRTEEAATGLQIQRIVFTGEWEADIGSFRQLAPGLIPIQHQFYKRQGMIEAPLQMDCAE